jgi:cytochrome c biogenesis protein
VISQEGAVWHLFAEKTPWCRLAVYVVHLSIIVIFIGALIGSLFGFKGMVNILEGDTVGRIMLRSEKEYDLGFALHLDQFSVAKYANGAPKEFKSIITVAENGKPVPGYTNVRVIVNEPLTYKGITFYQSSYGNAGSYYFDVSTPDGKTPATIAVNADSSAQLSDGSSMHVIEATDDVSEFSKELSGPAANIELHTRDGRSERMVVYANYPELNRQRAKEHGAPVIQYKGAEKLMYTGLQVSKDPGVEIVWFGCLLMVVGVYVAFFLSHRRVWIRIEGNTVTVGGNASKNPAGFQQAFEGLVDKLKSELGSK